MTYEVNLRGWPGLNDWKPPRAPSPYADRLADRVGLVYFAAATVGTQAERFGLGGSLEFAGPSIVREQLITSDGLENIDPVGAHAIAAYADAAGCATVTRAKFFDPRSGTFAKRCYSGAGWCVGAELGRSLGVSAEHCGGRRGRHAGEWEVWLPGWGHETEKGWKRVSPHRPALYVRARRVGWQIEFGPCGKDNDGNPAGKRVRGRVWSGAFIDTMSLAYLLDSDRAASFGEHRSNFGLAPVDLPTMVTVDARGAARILEVVHAIHELVVVLDGR